MLTVRSTAGAEVKLMVDFNQGLSLGDALHRCRALDSLGLYWFEEPVAYDNLAGYARLARGLHTPVQLGENFYGPRAMHQALAMQAGDYVMPDLMRIGGVAGWLRAAAIAGGAGIEMSSHLYPEFSAHLLRVTETAHGLNGRIGRSRSCSQPFKVADGMIEVPDRPGAGIEWNEDAVERHRQAPYR
jgi:mandelate racemase